MFHSMMFRGTFVAATAFSCAFLPGAAWADTLSVVIAPPGYDVVSVELGVPFAGSLAQDPSHENVVYVSAGEYGDSDHDGIGDEYILRLDTLSGTTETVAAGFGSIGGLAVLNNGDLAIADNADFTSDTLLRARDLNHDGDFLDAGEITELIAPFPSSAGFTGSQLLVAPDPNAEGLPGGTLLLQTADGSNSSLYAIANPETTPSYRPLNGAFYSGFAFNGGIAFVPDGNLILGSSNFPTGNIFALVNLNGDEVIGAGESHELGEASNSVSDLCVTAESLLLFTENDGTVEQSTLPSDLLQGSIHPGPFLGTNGSYLSAVRLDFPTRRFAREGEGPVAHLYVGGYAESYAGATNLLKITPRPITAAADWEMYE